MGYYRGVSDSEARRRRLDRMAASMRQRYLNTGKGCKTRAKVIERRTRGAS